MKEYMADDRIVLTLDAGGTNLVFSAIQGTREIADPVSVPCIADDLEQLLSDIESGFRQVMDRLSDNAYAISFAFPGPANYREGIIGDLPNLPAFRGGVALGPFLERKFKLPVFINNDANLYVLGEYIFGFLPWINRTILEGGGTKQYRNLLGLTLGSGFGGGIMIDGVLNIGDNSNGGEIWLMRNKNYPELCADASIGNEKLRRFYAGLSHTKLEDVPDSKAIFGIARGELPGNADAAIKSFNVMGEIIGDAIANASVLVDGLVVIGGGLSGAHEFLMPAIMHELNGTIDHMDGQSFPRIAQRAFDLRNERELEQFIRGEQKSIPIPLTGESVSHDPMPRIGIGISRLGASKATSLGAYAFAITA